MVTPRQAVKSGLWYAAYRVVTQAFTWIVTLVVASLLSPEDYGLIAMATVLTMYMEMFQEFGLGSAMVQRASLSQEEASSIFWILLVAGFGFCGIGMLLAYPTAWIFGDVRVIPVTQAISTLFIVGGALIVPYSLLRREMRFRDIGRMRLVAAAISGMIMLALAFRGFGVWTLVVGVVFLRVLMLVQCFAVSRWIPRLRCRVQEVRPFLRFGLNVAGSHSAVLGRDSLINLIIGRVLGAGPLGLFSYANDLASAPNDKIMSLVQEVGLSTFSRHKQDRRQIREMYLVVQEYAAITMTPLFLVGILYGADLVEAVLGANWAPAGPLFRLLCVAQWVHALTVMNAVVVKAQGRPHWDLAYNAALALVIPAAVLLWISRGLEAVVYPWVFVMPLGAVIFTLAVLRTLEIGVGQFARRLVSPLLAAGLIALAVTVGRRLPGTGVLARTDRLPVLVAHVAVVLSVYALWFWCFHRDVLRRVWQLRGQ